MENNDQYTVIHETVSTPSKQITMKPAMFGNNFWAFKAEIVLTSLFQTYFRGDQIQGGTAKFAGSKTYWF